MCSNCTTACRWGRTINDTLLCIFMKVRLMEHPQKGTREEDVPLMLSNKEKPLFLSCSSSGGSHGNELVSDFLILLSFFLYLFFLNWKPLRNKFNSDLIRVCENVQVSDKYMNSEGSESQIPGRGL